MHRTEQNHSFGSDRTRFNANEDFAWTASSMLEWDGYYIDLVDLPTIRPYLETLIGRNYRLDHDYIKIGNTKHSKKLYLHGGGIVAHGKDGGLAQILNVSENGGPMAAFNKGGKNVLQASVEDMGGAPLKSETSSASGRVTCHSYRTFFVFSQLYIVGL